MDPKRTAFIVIHGIGEQNPFEVLDPFSQGVIEELKRRNTPVMVSHVMAVRHGASGAPWNESFLRIASPNNEEWIIDIHEYYWAYLTEKKISVGEVWHWVNTTLNGTRKYAKENAQYEHRNAKGRSYAFRMRSIYWAMVLIYWIVMIIRALVPKLFGWTRWVREVVDQWGTAIIVGYIGDIAIYTTTDEKSDYFRIRQQILGECSALVDAVLEGDGKNPYDRVIIAGHSLGSAIAYDTLNRINVAANIGSSRSIEKLQGLVTFGSPLDKIAFFFREHTKPRETIRRQILDHLHSFKAKNEDFKNEPITVLNTLKSKLDGIPWVNYFCDKDPVSGHLDFYKITEQDNVKLDFPQRWGVAHIGYWEHPPFYEDIMKRFF